MKKNVLFLIILLLITSCSSQKKDNVATNLESGNDSVEIEQENAQNEIEEDKPNYEELLGKVIILEEEKYRVIGVEDSEVKVIAFKSAGSGSFGSTNSVNFGSVKGIKYADSNADSIMNKWYDKQSDNMKNAIVLKEINQNVFLYSTKPSDKSINLGWSEKGVYYNDINESVVVGERYVYAVDLKDLIDYLGYGMSKDELDKVFFEDNDNLGFVWFRSADTMEGYTGTNLPIIYTKSIGLTCLSQELSSYGDYGTGTFRPCFVIDLSKIEYTVK